jgi:hypothetical protein
VTLGGVNTIAGKAEQGITPAVVGGADDILEQLYYNIERNANVVVYFLAKVLSHVFMCMSTVHTVHRVS